MSIPYEQREVMEVYYKITEGEVIVETDSTSFVNRRFREFPDADQLLKDLASLRKKLKSKGVSIGRRGYKKEIEKRKTEYNAKVKEYEETFSLLKEGWEKKMETGLRYGVLDDPDYPELQKLEFKLQSMNYRSHVLSVFLEIERDIKSISEELDFDNGMKLVKVYL